MRQVHVLSVNRCMYLCMFAVCHIVDSAYYSIYNIIAGLDVQRINMACLGTRETSSSVRKGRNSTRFMLPFKNSRVWHRYASAG